MIDIACPWTPTSIFPALSNLKHGVRRFNSVAEKQISEVDCQEKLGPERPLSSTGAVFRTSGRGKIATQTVTLTNPVAGRAFPWSACLKLGRNVPFKGVVCSDEPQCGHPLGGEAFLLALRGLCISFSGILIAFCLSLVSPIWFFTRIPWALLRTSCLFP